MINILILSVGTRNKIVQYFKRALTDTNGQRIGTVIATDMSNIAPAGYVADKFYQVPKMTQKGYIDIIFDICKKEKIKAVLSLIDPELALLASYAEKFRSNGIMVIGSPYELCELSMDKMRMYKWLVAHRYNAAKSYSKKDEFYEDLENGTIQFPVFVKPICGSASISINKAVDKDAVEFLLNHSENMMIQEYLNGQEIGADVYIDMISGEVVSIFLKKKIVMRAGETDKALSFKSEELFRLIKKFVEEAGFRGQIDIDIFEIDGKYYISEVNPRFGGGYPHAYECGCDHMQMILNNIQGKINHSCFGQYEENVYMMKYNEVMIKKMGEK